MTWVVIKGYFDVDGQAASYSEGYGPFATEEEAHAEMATLEASADTYDVFAVIQMVPRVDRARTQA